jgi:HJR/Mrr/RecB family endonuclease
MSKRSKRNQTEGIDLVVRFVIGLLILGALIGGGIQNFIHNLKGLIALVIALAAVAGMIYFGYKLYRENYPPTLQVMPRSAPNPINVTRPQPEPQWDYARIANALGEIDWFQFEKFSAALLRSQGYQVERKGGAQPDGGVDLIAIKDGQTTLVQCKHWRTWTVQEKVIRELLGSMTHFKAQHGMLYTLKGWTRPAADFAAQHNIQLFDARALTTKAEMQLSAQRINEFLYPRFHHCPTCEAEMVKRTGRFKAFWGCSRFPACRGILTYSGAR